MILTPKAENLPQATAFLTAFLEESGCSPRTGVALETVLEEVFMNVVNHSGATVFEVTVEREGGEIRLCFSDDGIPFNPLLRAEPDTTLPAEARDIGGLGVLMMRRMTDRQAYAYQDGRNILTVHKRIA